MFRTVCAALPIALRIASSTLTGLLPTISLSRYTWSLTVPPPRTQVVGPDPGTPARLAPCVRTSRAPGYVVRQIWWSRDLTSLRVVPERLEGAPDDRSGPRRRPSRPGPPAHRPGRRPGRGRSVPAGPGRRGRRDVADHGGGTRACCAPRPAWSS